MARGRQPSNRYTASDEPRRMRFPWFRAPVKILDESEKQEPIRKSSGLLRVVAVTVLWAAIGFMGMIFYYSSTLPDTSELLAESRGAGVTILDVHGRTIAVRGASSGPVVQVENLPPHLSAAVLAIEDRRFYSHIGVYFRGLGRATLANLEEGAIVQGGSTITQQLAKNLFLTSERTFGRKIQETLLALWLEARFSKNEILTLYLNRVYFGGGAYGIEAAANRYFDIAPRDLDLHQSAMLAGVLKAPSRYSPAAHPEAAEARMNVVLAAMVDAGFLDAEAQALSDRAPVAYALATATNGSGYFVDWLMERLPAYIGDVQGNIIVETSLDLDLQFAAEQSLSATLDEFGEARDANQGAVIAFDLNGGVVAMVGGRSYAASQFNRASQARRQPGSAFKPFVYVTALEAGYRPDSMMEDEPVNIDGWTPENFSGEYEGYMTLQEALAKSVNSIAAQLIDRVGSENVADTARRMGIASELNAFPSLALGAIEVTPLELTSAYVPLGNGGLGIIPHGVVRITTASGDVLFERSGSGPGRVLDPRPTADMVAMLSNAIANGTGRSAYLPSRPSAGKTGTSQDSRDAWFVGFTGNYVAGVWIGNDDNSHMARVTGGSLPAAVWRNFMVEAHEGIAPTALAGRLPVSTVVVDLTDGAATESLLGYELDLVGRDEAQDPIQPSRP